MAIRTSLGAGRLRIFRQLLTESLLLSLLGGLAGAILGWWFTRLLASIHLLMAVTIRMNPGFDGRLFAYIGLVVTGSGLAVGLVPAWRASRMNLNAVLREGSHTSSPGSTHQRLRSALVVAQVAGTLIVLITAGLFIRSLQSAMTADPGFRSDGVLNLSMDPSQIGYDEVRGTNFFHAERSSAGDPRRRSSQLRILHTNGLLQQCHPGAERRSKEPASRRSAIGWLQRGGRGLLSHIANLHIPRPRVFSIGSIFNPSRCSRE
jgi:hypothetical protein